MKLHELNAPEQIPLDLEPEDEGGDDNTGKTCVQCERGKYKETSQHDDMDGVLHCDGCGDQINRYGDPYK